MTEMKNEFTNQILNLFALLDAIPFSRTKSFRKSAVMAQNNIASRPIDLKEKKLRSWRKIKPDLKTSTEVQWNTQRLEFDQLNSIAVQSIAF